LKHYESMYLWFIIAICMYDTLLPYVFMIHYCNMYVWHIITICIYDTLLQYVCWYIVGSMLIYGAHNTFVCKVCKYAYTLLQKSRKNLQISK
jgi:hypothetical protein